MYVNIDGNLSIISSFRYTIGVIQNQSLRISGTATFISLKKGVKRDNITPKEKANIVCKSITGTIQRKVIVTLFEVNNKKIVAKEIDNKKTTGYLSSTPNFYLLNDLTWHQLIIFCSFQSIDL